MGMNWQKVHTQERMLRHGAAAAEPPEAVKRKLKKEQRRERQRMKKILAAKNKPWRKAQLAVASARGMAHAHEYGMSAMQEQRASTPPSREMIQRIETPGE